MVLGMPAILLMTLAVYMAAVVIITRVLKRIFYFAGNRDKKHPVLLTWVVGFFIYPCTYVFKIQEFGFVSLVLYIITTGLLTAGYKLASFTGRIRNRL
ncbi:MAG: hypothetical protein GY950_30985 [bacterium]|nr:hypothetical protein [bacterium]